MFPYIHFFIFQSQRIFVLIFKAEMEQKGEESCPNQDILLAQESSVLHKNQTMTPKCNICDKICQNINGLSRCPHKGSSFRTNTYSHT